MKLTNNQLDKLCNLACEAAQLAGEYIAQKFKQEIKVQKKLTGTSLAAQVVTEVDIKSQDIIVNHLQSTLTDYDLGLLTEEGVQDQSRFEKDYFWCIDPLDGTLPFTRKEEGFAVSIALVSRKGESLIGVVYDPYRCDLYAARIGSGATKNGNPLELIEADNEVFFYRDCSFLKSKNNTEMFDRLQSELPSLEVQSLRVKESFGAVMQAINVIQRPNSIYFKVPKKEFGGGSSWDFAATVCIANEMNTHVSDAKGNPLTLNSQKSTFMNEKGVLFASSEKLVKWALFYNHSK